MKYTFPTKAIALLSTCSIAFGQNLLPTLDPNDPFADDGDPFADKSGAQVTGASGKAKTEEEKQVAALSPRDKVRYEGFKDFTVYRNVSSIMEMEGKLALPDSEKRKDDPPEKPDYSKLPKDPVKAKKMKAKMDAKYQKKVLMHEVGIEFEQFHSDIMLGKWDKVRAYFAKLPPVISKRAYSRITTSLCSSQQVRPMAYLQQHSTGKSQQEPVMLTTDILQWLDMPVEAPTSDDIRQLATLLDSEGELPNSFYDALAKGTRYLGGSKVENKIRAGELLLFADRPKRSSRYLIPKQQALQLKNYHALNLLAIYHQKLYTEAPFSGHLQQAWGINRALLDLENTPLEITEQAMMRSFELLPKLRDKSKGAQWFKDTFKAKRKRGMTLLSFVGNVTAQSQGNKDENFRLGKIKLQHATANALINSAKNDLGKWESILTLYAKNWIHEAEFSFARDKSTTIGPSLETDSFGNVYYAQQNYEYNRYSDKFRPIKSGDILVTGPDEAWLSVLDEQTKLVCLKNFARLYLKMKQDETAFSYIEQISAINPDEAKRFIGELIKVWADNHDPNAAKSYRNSWYYSYGYNQRADSIPLTRSKQQRNLQQLKQLVERLKTIGISKDDEVALARAFIRCHSKAEIWRMDTFQEIFGDTKTLSPETINAVIQTMRANLVRVWPNPKLQKQMKTKRTDVELQQEVVKGYQSAIALCDSTLAIHPDDWSLTLQKAALMFGMNEYLTLIGKNSNTAAKKQQALATYADAAEKYSKQLSAGETRPVMTVYENWFYATLGSADLATLKSKHLLNSKEIPKIKASLESLPVQFKEMHMDQFANVLATRISGVGPDLKLRYLKAGLEIAGDNKRADEARKLQKYYADLVNEIQIIAEVDGSSDIDHTQPFGVIVKLRHTKEIEREAGGFSKYLQNQSSNGGWNYGRPTEDYRDKFSEKVMAVMDEHFEVKSITFHKDSVESYTDKEYGWRVTPYAYIELQAKGPQVDSIPSMQIDFDFLDTTNYVVIPIESAKIPINCNVKQSPRPVSDLKITQIFDDRQMKKEGKILLEVSAEGHGIIPPIDEMLDIKSLDGYEILKIDDKGSQVKTLDPASSNSPAISKRNAIVHLKPLTSNSDKTFSFPEATVPLMKDKEKQKGMTLQRYEDVDLVTVGKTIDIEVSKSWTWWQIALISASGLIILLLIIYLVRKANKQTDTLQEAQQELIPMPNNLTPVTALSVLKRVREEKPLNPEQDQGLVADMEQIMQSYFGKNDSNDENQLKQTVQKWIRV